MMVVAEEQRSGGSIPAADTGLPVGLAVPSDFAEEIDAPPFAVRWECGVLSARTARCEVVYPCIAPRHENREPYRGTGHRLRQRGCHRHTLLLSGVAY